MSLEQQISKGIMEAMKAKDKDRKDSLSMLLSALKNAEIDKRSPLTEEEADAVVKKEIKQVKETIDTAPADRADIIEEAKKRLAVYQEFAPADMTEDQIRETIAKVLAELGIDSIPINALMPIPGTPLEHLPRLSEADILRTIAFFRYINPDANIRLAAGRALLTNDGESAFQAGASASITGNMLTTVACATIRSDRRLLEDLGRDVTPEYWKEEKSEA